MFYSLLPITSSFVLNLSPSIDLQALLDDPYIQMRRHLAFDYNWIPKSFREYMKERERESGREMWIHAFLKNISKSSSSGSEFKVVLAKEQSSLVFCS